jgi:hypothetical protein
MRTNPSQSPLRALTIAMLFVAAAGTAPWVASAQDKPVSGAPKPAVPAAQKPAAGAPKPAAPAEAKLKPPSVFASRIYRIGFMPESEVMGPLMAEIAAQHADVLGIPPHAAENVVKSMSVTESRGGQVDGVLHIGVDLRTIHNLTPKPRANEFLDAVIESLDARLLKWNQRSYDVDAKMQRLDQANADFAKRQAMVRDLEERVRTITGRSDVTLSKVGATLPKLEEQRETLRLEVLGKQARQDALAASIEKLAKAAAERVETDPVAAELEKVVQARQQSYERTAQLHQTGNVSESELAQARAVVAEARAKMLERREAVKESSGGDLLGGLNRELATLSIDIAEGTAKLKAVEDLVSKYGEARQLLEGGEDLPRDKQMYDDLRHRAELELREARGRIPASTLELMVSQSYGPDDPRYQRPPSVDGAPADPAAVPPPPSSEGAVPGSPPKE